MGYSGGRLDDRLAAERLGPGREDRLVAEGGRFELGLDLQGDRVPDLVQRREGLVGGQVPEVTGRAALERLGVGLQGEGAELPDAGVELLVAGSQSSDSGAAERAVRAGQNLGYDPAVVLVVVLEPGQVHQGRADVGLIGPGAGGAAVDDLDLAAVRAGRVRAVGRARAVQAQVLDPGSGQADVVGVDLRRVVAVVPGEPGVLRHARG